MKKVLIGGFTSLIGSIWALAIILIAGSNLLSVVFVIAGIIVMAIEFFREEQ